jgi:transposase
MEKKRRYPAEVRERAVRLVFEQQASHTSQWAAIEAIAAKIGCTGNTLSSAPSASSSTLQPPSCTRWWCAVH